MYPVVIGNGRCTTSDCVIHGYQIPKGVSALHFVCAVKEWKAAAIIYLNNFNAEITSVCIVGQKLEICCCR